MAVVIRQPVFSSGVGPVVIVEIELGPIKVTEHSIFFDINKDHPMRLRSAIFIRAPVSWLRVKGFEICFAIAVVISPFDTYIKWSIVKTVTVSIDLQAIIYLVAASIGRLHVAIFIQPAHAFAVPPSFDYVGFTIFIDIDSDDFIRRRGGLQRGSAQVRLAVNGNDSKVETKE